MAEEGAVLEIQQQLEAAEHDPPVLVTTPRQQPARLSPPKQRLPPSGGARSPAIKPTIPPKAILVSHSVPFTPIRRQVEDQPIPTCEEQLHDLESSRHDLKSNASCLVVATIASNDPRSGHPSPCEAQTTPHLSSGGADLSDASLIEEGRVFVEGILCPETNAAQRTPESNAFTATSRSNRGKGPKMRKALRRRGRVCVGSCIAFLRKGFRAFLLLCWLVVSSLASNVRKVADSTSSSLISCYRYHVWVLSMAPDALRAAAHYATGMKRGVALCLLSITLSMFTEIYPTAPNGNVFVGMLMLLFHIQPTDWQEKSKRHAVLLMVVVAISIFIDVDWLTAKYLPLSLGEDELAFRIKQDGSFAFKGAWWGVLANAVIKVLCLNETLKTNEHGRSIRARCGRIGRKFLISTQVADLDRAIKDKIVVIAVMELICSLLSFGCFFAIEFDVVNSPLFWNVPNQLASMQGLLLIKGTSGFLVFLSLVRHVRVKDFACGLQGYICPGLIESGSGRLSLAHRIKRSSKCLVFAKVLDFAVAISLWTCLAKTHAELGFDAPKDIAAFQACVFSTQVATSIVAPVMGLAVAWYIRMSRRSPRRPRSRNSSSRTRSRRHHRRSDSSVDSESSPQRRSDFDETPVKDMTPVRRNNSDYDLRHPATSQSLFQARLTGAWSNSRDMLEESVSCTPQQYQSEWKSLPPGSEVSHRVDCLPSLSDCHRYFHARRFHVVASGSTRAKMTLYLIAQRRPDRSMLRSDVARCLVEITLGSGRVNAEVRCREEEVRSFLVALDLPGLAQAAST